MGPLSGKDDADALAARLCAQAIDRVGQRRPHSAAELLRRAARTAGASPAGQRALRMGWQLARAQRDWPAALAAGMVAARMAPLDFAFANAVVRTLGDAVAAGWRGEPPRLALPAALPSLSFVVVSRDDARHAAFDAECARTFAAWPHERIRIPDATSMYDGYGRGFARANGDFVVFAHDDTRFTSPDFAARLADAMRQSDVVGVAGATRVDGPSLLGAGHPHLHGAITHLAQHGLPCEFAVLSLAGPRIEGAQGVDGVFIAARRACIERVGFDPARIDGFHFYDLDFSHRAALAGARVTIACDLALHHASRGALDERYVAAQRQFAAKFPHLAAPASPHRHWYALPVADPQAATALHDALLAAWSLPAL